MGADLAIILSRHLCRRSTGSRSGVERTGCGRAVTVLTRNGCRVQATAPNRCTLAVAFACRAVAEAIADGAISLGINGTGGIGATEGEFYGLVHMGRGCN